jgi:hypothetical protein
MSGSETTKRVTIKEEAEEIPVTTREDSGGVPETWDTEEGSYQRFEFVPTTYRRQTHVFPCSYPYFLPSVVDYLLSHLVDASSIGGNQPQQQPPQHGSLPVFSSSSSSSNREGADDDDDDDPKGFPPPATPAVQFYAGHHHHQHHHQQQQHNKPSSQNGETATATQPAVANPVLTSMAASLVTGGPVLQQQVQQHQHPPPPFDPSDGSKKPGLSESPISPAAIIGSGQENLMLPPPPQYGVDKEALQKQRELEKQQHLAWLQQINAMARMANQHQQQQQQGQAQHANRMMMAQQQQQAMSTQQQPPMIHHAGFPPIPPAVAAALYAGALSNGAPSQKQPESEEKRAKRLARNAESARNSRRRKKERLQLLSQKVAKLFSQLEQLRRDLMRSMEPSLQQERQNAIAVLNNQSDSVTEAQLRAFLEQHSPNRVIRQAVMTFQFAQWRQLLLPRYQEFLLWWTAQPISFLTAAREERAKSDAAQVRIVGIIMYDELQASWAV